jgi:hypothetical protein
MCILAAAPCNVLMSAAAVVSRLFIGCCSWLAAYRESNAALARSVLVFNTGRSKGQLIWLLKEKPMLAVPDVLITAVGTKVRAGAACWGCFQGAVLWTAFPESLH